MSIKNMEKDVFISTLIKKGASVDEADKLWQDFLAFSTKMNSVRKDFSFSLEEVYVIIESLLISKNIFLGTKTGDSLVNKLSIFMLENDITPPHETDTAQLLMSAIAQNSEDIREMFSDELSDVLEEVSKKKDKRYIN